MSTIVSIITIFILIIGAASMVWWVVMEIRDLVRYIKWRHLGLIKKRKDSFYKYGQFFIANNADCQSVRDDILAKVNELKIMSIHENREAPFSLHFSDGPEIAAEFSLLGQDRNQSLYAFRFSKVKHVNGHLQHRKNMNALLSVVENTLQQYDPAMKQLQKEMKINKTYSFKFKYV